MTESELQRGRIIDNLTVARIRHSESLRRYSLAEATADEVDLHRQVVTRLESELIAHDSQVCDSS